MMTKYYAQQILEGAKLSKETLLIRKEIILDDDLTNEQLGEIIRQMYRAKATAEDETINRCLEVLNS